MQVLAAVRTKVVEAEFGDAWQIAIGNLPIQKVVLVILTE